jgi:hypothetical protein
MVYQTTKDIDPAIRKSGCYFLCIIRIFEIITKQDLTVSEVNKIFNLCDRVGYIGSDGYMKEDAAQGVAQVASGLIKKHAYIKRVFEDNSHNFCVGKYVNSSTHFILMPGPENKEYDPWSSNGSNTVKTGKFHSPRYYLGEKI